MGRAALPSFALSSGFQYFISATCTSPAGINEVIDGTVDQEAKTYTIGLTLGRTYTLTASLKKVDATGNSTETLMEAEWPNVKPSRENTNFNHDFMLKPEASGSGTIALEITVPSGIEAEISGDEWNNLSPKPLVSTSGTKVTISGSDIPVGNYLVSINFYKVDPSGSQFLQYSIPQTINVLAKMETNTWQDGGSSSSPISGNTFVLTDTMIQNFQRTIFYVSKDKDFTGTALPDDLTRTGSPYAPFAALQTAIDAIKTSSSAEDYKIYIDGNVIGSADIPSSITTSNAKSITISGYTGNDTVDVIIADNGKRVLTIATTVPLVIKNLKITGGNFSVGGGIYMDFGTKLTLDSGALVGDDEQSLATGSSGGYGNKASSYGGGIYNSGGTLLLKKGSKVCRNYCFNDVSEDTNTGGGGIASERGSITIEDGAMISYNKTGGHGGGIWLMGGTNDNVLTMNGGTISYNEAQFWGGGVHVGSVDDAQGSSCPVKLNFKGGEICYNKIFSSYVTDNSDPYYTWGPNGAGVNVDHSYMEMSGSAKIHHNDSINTGGGVHVGSAGVFLMSGGEISENTCSREFDSDGVTPISGGGLDIEKDSKVVISGSAKIPYGVDGVKGYRKNDIWLRYSEEGGTPSYITVGGALTSTFEMGIGVTGQRGLVIAQADGTNVTDLTPYKDYFKIINTDNTDWLTNLSSKTKIVLDSPIYVSTSGSSAATTTGTKNDPFRTIQNAISKALTDTNVDYTILIDGELRATTVDNNGTTNGYAQEIIDPPDGSTIKAKSITIRGASASNGNPTDVINGLSDDGTKTARGLFIGTKIPVTIENLKITGGLADEGGGIYLSGEDTTLTLGNDVLITGNKAANGAGGIKIQEGSSLKVKGNAKVYGNNTLDGKPSNVYLADGQTIGVIGALINGSKKAQIGISTADEPSLTSKVTFTSGYGVYNYGVVPGTYFFGDKWTVTAGSGTVAGEAVLAASGGNITIEPIYEDITVKVDKSSVLKSATEKKFTFSAIGTDSEGNTNPITIGSGEGQLALTIDSVTYHGKIVPASYYDTGTDYVNLGNSLPAGNYIINTRAVYQGSLSEARTYSAGFEVKIKESNIENVSSGSQAVSVISAMTESGTIKYTGALTTAEIQSMKDALNALNTAKSDVEVTLDLSGVTGYTSIGTCYDFFYENPNIVSLTFPEGITEIPAGCLRGLSKLKILNLPSTVQTFGVEQICYLCPLLETVTIGGDPAGDNGTVKVVNNVVYSSDGKKLWFYGNKASTADLVVPDGVEEIYKWAFATSHFTKITLPSSLKTVGFGAFVDLDSTLTTVNYKGSESDKASITIDGWNEAITNLTWNYTGD